MRKRTASQGGPPIRRPITIKTPEEIARMRQAGAIVARVLALLAAHVRPGISTAELDELAYEAARREGAIPSFKGYLGYPASICASVNDAIVHGIPSKKRVLRAGDIVSIDFGAIYAGWHGDAAITVGVGPISKPTQRLLRVTYEALYKGIAAARPGNTIGDVGAAIERHALLHGYSVVRQYCGHGVGRYMHEEPAVPNFGPPGQGVLLRPGMTIAIEPMLCLGSGETKVDPDGWTVRTQDGLLSAHFEHTVVITINGPEVLTDHPPGALEQASAAALAAAGR